VTVTPGMPPAPLIHGAVAALWLYEGLWCKLLSGEPGQKIIVASVPKYGPLIGRPFLLALGVVEVAIGVWVLIGVAPFVCALTQTALLVFLNACGLLFARTIIHDPPGMVIKNVAFLTLAWVSAAIRS
jgi:hypothetical protein